MEGLGWVVFMGQEYRLGAARVQAETEGLQGVERLQVAVPGRR